MVFDAVRKQRIHALHKMKGIAAAKHNRHYAEKGKLLIVFAKRNIKKPSVTTAIKVGYFKNRLHDSLQFILSSNSSR